MEHTKRMLPRANPELASLAAELLHTMSRNLILASGGLYLTAYFLITEFWSGDIGWRASPTTALIIVVSLFSLWMLPRRFLLAQITWQIGVVAAITLALHTLDQPAIAFCYVFLPLIAVITVGWPAGLVMEGLIAAIVWWLIPASTGGALPPALGAGILVGGVFTGALGWVVTHSLLTVTEWSLFSFKQARQTMEDARESRAQLALVLKDLDQAYYRLERANASLVAAWKAADEAERFKTEFVTNVSHELRTPLNLILGFAETMMTCPESYDGAQLPGPYRSDLNAIYNSSQHLLALVDDVLDLARIEVGRISLDRDQVDLVSLVTEATAMIRDYIVAKGLDLRIHIAPDLPQIWIDRLRIRQVLLNLLVNAARFTERGWIEVDLRQQDEDVLVRVTDTGKGIPEQDLPRIFEEFRSTLQPISTWHSGTGLGLPISKKLVELHHGEMGVDSTQMQGASFWFRLPCRHVPAHDHPALGGKAGYQLSTRLHASDRIVVAVHDDPHIAPMLQRHLDGYQIVGTGNLAEGIAVARESRAIALVTDGAPPPLSQIPDDVLVVSCPIPSSREAAIALGADDLLIKPVSQRELWAAIERLDRPVHRVLVADDDPEVVRLFRRMLRPQIEAHNCLEAYNGEETLDLIEQETPDLVLLDLKMPKVDGAQVLAQMAAAPRTADIPVIIVSATIQDHTPLELPGPIQVSSARGFQTGEVIRTVEAMLGALAPGWS